MELKRRILSLAAAGGLAVAFAVAAPAPAFAGTGPSQACEDRVGNDDVPIFVTTPVTLGVQVSSPALAPVGLGGDGSSLEKVSLCYATSSYGNTTPETTGGIVEAQVLPGSFASLGCGADSNAYNPSTGGLAPSCAVVESATGTTVTFSLPFGVCAGSCVDNPISGTTGVIVGVLQEAAAPAGQVGGTFTLTSLCVLLNGATVTCTSPLRLGGATVNTSNPLVDVSPLGGCGALVCDPSYLGLSGANIAVIYLPGGLLTVPLNGEGICLLAPAGQPAPSQCTQ